MKITVGYPEHLGMGPPQIIDARPGEPITFEGLDLELAVHPGVGLTIRATGTNRPLIRPVSGNVIHVIGD